MAERCTPSPPPTLIFIKGEDMATVTHYTSFAAALLILLSGKIKLGNIRNCNDQIEIDNLPPNEKNDYFIFCTSEKNIDSLMWFAYAKNKFGACISFKLKKGKQKKSLLKKDKNLGLWRTGNIQYDTKLKFEVGFIKDSIFKREKEYRYLCKSKQEYICTDINWDVIENITLTLSSFFDNELIEKKVFKNLPVKVKVKTAHYFNC